MFIMFLLPLKTLFSGFGSFVARVMGCLNSTLLDHLLSLSSFPWLELDLDVSMKVVALCLTFQHLLDHLYWTSVSHDTNDLVQ